MLYLQIPFLAVLFAGGNSEDAFQEPISLQANYISYLYNHSWAQSWGSVWLGEMQIQGWESNSGSIVFLRPWAKSNFSNKEMKIVEKLVHGAHIQLLHTLRNRASEWKLEYPFDVQVIGGCELYPGRSTVGFSQLAYQGSELLSFQNSSWVPSLQSETRVQQIGKEFNRRIVFNKMTHWMISNTCPRFLFGLLDAGKADLQRKVKPEAWLSTGPSPGPAHLLLVCHVSGFYPKPISVMWMRGEQAQQGSQQSDILPNADGTWYLQMCLEVEATQTSGLSCRVTHSSLEGQDIILYLDRPHSKGLIIVAVMVPLVLLLTGLAFWLKKHWKHCELRPTLLPLERFQQPRDSKHT